MSHTMTTDGKWTNKLFKDMGAVKTPVFYIFGAVAVLSAIIVCGFQWMTIITAVFLVFLAAAGSSDYNKGIVPDLIVILIAVLAVIRFFLSGISVHNALNCLAGALVLSVPMLIAALIVKKGFGGGDIKLIAAAGLFLGLEQTIVAGIITFTISGIYAVIILVTKKGGAKSAIRLAPYLALGCAFSELFGSAFLFIFNSYI